MLLTKEAYNQLQTDFSQRWNRYVVTINHFENIMKQKEFVSKLLLVDAYRYQCTNRLIGMTINDVTPLVMTRARSLSYTDDSIETIISSIYTHDDFRLSLNYLDRYFIYNDGDDNLSDYLEYLHTLPAPGSKQTRYRDTEELEEND